MIKPDGYDQTNVGFQAIKPGFHKCEIMDVKESISHAGNNTLIVYFDCDGTDIQPRYFKELYHKHKQQFGEGARWRGVLYITITGEYGMTNLKRFVTAVEHSNKGFAPQWDLVPGDGTFASCFKGKKVGIVFRQEEYEKKDGSYGLAAKPLRTVDYNAKDVKIPEKKLLPREPFPPTMPTNNDPVMAEEGFYQVPDGAPDFPFK